MPTDQNAPQTLPADLLAPGGPACLIIKASLRPVGDLARFQPAGFPEIGHVLYDLPVNKQENGAHEKQRVCIVDSAASMANHLEAVCVDGQSGQLHPELDGLPYVACVTDNQFIEAGGKIVLDDKDPKNRVIVTSLSEGHRLASDYFLDATFDGRNFRELLRKEFNIIQVGQEASKKDGKKKGADKKEADKKGVTLFIPPGSWFSIYQTVFKYDPNSLLHGVLFAKEQIKISRLLTAHLEAFGAQRVGRSGVKFDRLGKTTSGQPIFSVDEETAQEIRATFILDLALLRSYGRKGEGLNDSQKKFLLDLAFWKINQLMSRPYRYRTGCHLACESLSMETETALNAGSSLPKVDIAKSIAACQFAAEPITHVYYSADKLFKSDKKDGKKNADASGSGTDEDEGEAEEETQPE